jgi:hypothetical protein
MSRKSPAGGCAPVGATILFRGHAAENQVMFLMLKVVERQSCC